MSRTIRKRKHEWEITHYHYDNFPEDLANYFTHNRTFPDNDNSADWYVRKWRYMSSQIGQPDNNSPKGHEIWGELPTGMKTKRWGKRMTSKINRRIAKKNINDILYE